MSTLGYRLRLAREKKELSQTEVCKKLNMANSTLSGYERDYRKPSPDMIKTFSDLYGVTTDYLLGTNNNENISTAFHDFDHLTEEEKDYLELQLEIFRKMKERK